MYKRFSIIMLAVALSSCGTPQQKASALEENKEAKSLLEGIWLDDNTETALLRVKGDTLFYADAATAPVAFKIIGDSLITYGARTNGYKIEKQGEHIFWFHSAVGDVIRKNNIASLESSIETNKNILAQGEETDTSSAEKEQQELKLEKNTLQNMQKAVHARMTSNKSARNNIELRSNEIKTVEERLIWVKSLSDTANGNISGKEKIMLETYIQMTYFDRIIRRANTRFMVMSSGQYELKRRRESGNNKAQSGLELDVIDHYNGTERSVKTLSGGESFKASLSLALGLSDEIQSSAGGIRLDSMFVDEGFGSLDDESLEQAVKALASLSDSNRLVGIISHVGDLKNRIDKQIIVHKDRSGGSRAEIQIL